MPATCPGKDLHSHKRAAAWVVVALWTAIVWGLGGDDVLFGWSARVLRPILQWWLPSASPELVSNLHFALRKLAHCAEYGLLALLTLRAVRSGRGDQRLRSLVLALAFCSLLSVADEWRQSQSSRRTGSTFDIGLDIGGAAVALITLLVLEATVLHPRHEGPVGGSS